jgi:hypothetical protein
MMGIRPVQRMGRQELSVRIAPVTVALLSGLASVRYPPTSAGLIELASRTPSDWICDPAVDVRFMPAGPVGADFELGRERALGNFAVDGGPGQSGPCEDGFQPDDAVWFAHGRAASCWLFLMASETRQDMPL